MSEYLATATRQGHVVWQTDIVLVTAACQFISQIETGEQLRRYASRLAKEQLTDHDRRLIGAVYLAKQKILIESGGWSNTDVTLTGHLDHGLLT